jgi:hypothetical protein
MELKFKGKQSNAWAFGLLLKASNWESKEKKKKKRVSTLPTGKRQ